MKKVLAIFASLYAYAFLAEGCLALADGALNLAAHSAILGALHGALAFVVLGVAVLLYGAMGLSPMLPRRVFAAAVLFPIGMLLVTTPLYLWLAGPLSIVEMIRFDPATVSDKAPSILVLGAGVALLQVGVGAFTVRAIRCASSGKQWLLAPEALTGSPFSFGRAAFFAVANGLILGVGLPLYLFMTVIVGVNALGRGFVVCDRHEVAMVSKDYARDGKVVSLVGMMHIAEKGSYRRLVDSIDPKGAVLLAEGVTDRKHRIQQKTDYRKAATTLGLETQAEFRPEETGLEVVPADVDAEIFAPETVEVLNRIFAIHEGRSPAVGDMLRLRVALSDPAVIETLFRDIVDRRNAHLLSRIDEALESHDRVIVPWGAYHLPDIGLALLAKGFTIVRTETRTVLEFATVWNRLWAREPGGAGTDPAGAERPGEERP